MGLLATPALIVLFHALTTSPPLPLHTHTYDAQGIHTSLSFHDGGGGGGGGEGGRSGRERMQDSQEKEGGG